MSAAAKLQGQAMYVVSKDDRLWLLSAQRKLHAQSREHPSYVFEKLWGLAPRGAERTDELTELITAQVGLGNAGG